MPGAPACGPGIGPADGATDAHLIRLASRVVAAGEWTTYGDLAVAATGRRLARLAGRLAAGDGAFANAHRILGSGGVVVRPSEADARRSRRLLEAEGVRFRGRAADPARRARLVDLRGRLLAAAAPRPGRSPAPAVPAPKREGSPRRLPPLSREGLGEEGGERLSAHAPAAPGRTPA